MKLILSAIICLLAMTCHAIEPSIARSDRNRHPEQNSGSPLFKIGIVTDVHHADKPDAKGRHYRASLSKLKEAIGEFNREKVDMVISLGDLIDNEISSFQDLDSVLKRLEMAFIPLMGNHDYLAPFSEEQRKTVMKSLGIEKTYHSVCLNGYRLMFLDGTDIAKYSHPEGSREHTQATETLNTLKEAGHKNCKDYNGAIGKRQMRWIAGEFRKASKRNEKVICFCHMPVFPIMSKFTLWNGNELAELMNEHQCVKAFIAGHHHAGGYGRHHQVEHLTMKGMIEGETNSFAILSFYDDRIEVKGYGRENDHIIIL